MPETKVDIASAREHIGEIERGIRFIKEQCCGTQAIIPFKQLQKPFVINLVYFSVMWINMFSSTQGISKNLYPHKIVLKQSIIFERHAKYLFG